ncbi:MAG: hypothetical protein ISQ11_12035 [Planctomycetes bacterium]|nr:hypothetical protein [Planctomycetota bacterium]
MSAKDTSSAPAGQRGVEGATARVETPRLNALLRRLRGSLSRGVLLHGVGTVVAAGAAWLLFMYAADRLLRLPAPVRILHLTVLAGGTLYLLRRSLFQHVRALPGRAELAMLAERAVDRDRQQDLFVSAVQLDGSVPADSPAAELVRDVAARAEELAASVDLRRVTDGRGPRRRMATALVALAAAAAGLSAEPAMARIFAARMLGANVAWPRATTLEVTVPDDAPGLEVQRPDEEMILVRAARGSDVPLLVTALGDQPEFVTVTFESGTSIEVGPSGPGQYRTLLPSLQESTSLTVVGGDDDRRVPKIVVEVLQPPDIAGLAFVIEPPAYAGLPIRTESETKVSVLAGSRVTVHVKTDPVDATGIARTFPDDQVRELESVPFPRLGPAPTEGEAPDPSPGLSFSDVMLQSLRFRVELTDAAGLENPDPALFGIEVVPDRRPELLVLAPGRSETEVVESGVVPLRVLVRDDFGVGGVRLEGRDAATDEVLDSRPLDVTMVADPTTASEGRTRVAALASTPMEVKALFPAAESLVGSVTALFVEAKDSREPEPNVSRTSALLVRVVSTDEFMRGQRDGLSAAAEAVERLDRTMEPAKRDLQALLASLSGDAAELPDPGALVRAANEARRQRGDLRSIARDLSGLAEAMIYSRLDERSGALERRLVELTAASTERSFDDEAWAAISDELAAGQLGNPERAGDLVRIVGLALEATGPRMEAWISSLEAVRDAGDLESASSALAEADLRLTELRATMDRLTGELGEWDSLQSVLSLTRDILSRQKNLKERTRKAAENDR